MKDHQITRQRIISYARYLYEEERSPGTIDKYLRDIERFAAWLAGGPATKEWTAAWKESLLHTGHAPVTVNAMLGAIHGLFRFLGWEECRVKLLKIQRRLFRDQSRDLSRMEYAQLLKTASKQGRTRLALLMETICATGIRVSEVQYITLDAAQKRQTEISLKGKIRTILLPDKLCRKLLQYAQKQKIASGEIFLTKSGTSLSRKQIWAEMKTLCAKAGIAPTKVFPHNLRHLFARTFYKVCRDVAKLADLLGHSSIETTRIYLTSTGEEHAKQLDRLKLVR